MSSTTSAETDYRAAAVSRLRADLALALRAAAFHGLAVVKRLAHAEVHGAVR